MIDLEWIVRRIEVEGEIKLPLHLLTLEDCKILNKKYKIYFVREKDFVLLDTEKEQETSTS